MGTLVWEGLSRMVVFYCILLVLSVPLPVHSEPIDEVFAAIRGGKEKDVKRILEENVDSLASFINKQDPPSGQTPLMMAVLMGKEEAVRLLLKEGRDLTFSSNIRFTSFSFPPLPC